MSVYIHHCQVGAQHIDELEHVNNAAYLYFMEDTAWAHSKVLGLEWADFQKLGVGLVVRENHLVYLADARLGDELAIHTWIVQNDRRLRIRRNFKIYNATSQRLLLTGQTLYIPIELASGKPKRMPPEFIKAYKVCN